jgi:hypothetical protein
MDRTEMQQALDRIAQMHGKLRRDITIWGSVVTVMWVAACALRMWFGASI